MIFSKFKQEQAFKVYSLNDYFDHLYNIIYVSTINLFNHNLESYVKYYFYHLTLFSINDLVREINIMKISFEVILVIYRKYKISYPQNKNIVKKFLAENIQYIDETIDIDEFLDYTITFQSRPFFIELLKKLDDYMIIYNNSDVSS